MSLSSIVSEVNFVALKVAIKSFEIADKAAQRVPLVRPVHGLILDTLFGPEDDWDYVSTTQPVNTPL